MKKIIVFLFVMFSLVAFGEEKKITLEIDNTNIFLGESVSFNINFEGMNNNNSFKLEGLENFEVLSSGTSSRMEIINNKRTTKNTQTYILLPKAKGKFVLSASIESKGEIYKSNILNIEVSDKPKQENAKSIDNHIYTETVLSKENIYFGEKIILENSLITRKYNVSGFRYNDDKKYNNFMAKQIPNQGNNAKYINIDGQRAIKYSMDKFIMTPVKSGNLKLNSRVVRADLEMEKSSGIFGFAETKPFFINTDARDIEVLALPLEGKPKDFYGIVGNLNVESKYGSTNIEYGDSITLNVKLFGDVNLDSIDRVLKNDFDNFKIYETSKNSEEVIKNGNYYAERSFDIIIIPENTGTVKFPEIRIPYFNVKKQKYEYAKIRGVTINVKGDKLKVDSNFLGNSDNQETIEINQLNNILEDKVNNDFIIIKIKKIYLKLAIYLSMIIILIVILLIIIIKIINNRKSDPNKMLFKRIKSAKSIDDFYNVLNEITKEKLEFSIKSVAKSEILNRVSEEEIALIVLNLVDEIELSKYSGTKSEGDFEEKLKELLNKILKSSH